ncbi:MAG: YicC family protein [Gemmatimonadetes bacterium]|nr:YicC family protein [Gemmatimonadota bacterium]
MIRSMTGYGEAERVFDDLICRVEIRTVNHRFFNANFRAPSTIARLEIEIQKVLQEKITRGHVNYLFSVQSIDSSRSYNLPSLDLDRAKAHWEALKIRKKELGIVEDIGLSHIMTESFSRSAENISTENIRKEDVIDLTKEALEEVIAFRCHEGLNIEKDLKQRSVILKGLLENMEKRAPERLIAERDRLQEAVKELLEGNSTDQDRLSREVAILADKWDISEEIVRFRSHLDLFSKTMATDRPLVAGKKLGFILQEIHREVNTINSKANDSTIGNAAIAAKEEIECIREQLENVE